MLSGASRSDRPWGPPSTIPAGWYADPTEPGWVRWWDGVTWREWRHPTPPSPRRGRAIWATIGAAVGGALLWLLSIAILLTEDLSDEGSSSLDAAKRVAAIAFFAMPVIVAAVITLIWAGPAMRRRRQP